MNREGQRWTEDRAGMTLRLPIDLREAVTEEARVAGDLSRVVLFALRNIERKDEGVSVNAIMVSVLKEFFKRLRKSKALREELRLELRAQRGFLPS